MLFCLLLPSADGSLRAVVLTRLTDLKSTLFVRAEHNHSATTALCRLLDKLLDTASRTCH